MKTNEVKELVLEALTDMKAKDIIVLDVAESSTFTDLMVICSGGSNRQVKAIASEVVQRTKAANIPPLGVEGDAAAEWVLVDLGDLVVHVMQQSTRDFYQLEKLWDPDLAES
jgi:ribosome-associated protein